MLNVEYVFIFSHKNTPHCFTDLLNIEQLIMAFGGFLFLSFLLFFYDKNEAKLYTRECSADNLVDLSMPSAFFFEESRFK